jgi:hypothetical protein
VRTFSRADWIAAQQAMLIRAIRETPLLLEQSVTGSRSWSQVLDKLLAARDKQRRKVAV